MKQPSLTALTPRKQPVQARSEATVRAMMEASIQVLLAVGYRKLTTTRVAERAGASVGTVYQYFPNRQALVATVLEHYLAEMSASVEADCRALAGLPLREMAEGLVDALLEAKFRRLEVSRAMHEPLLEVGGIELVRAATQRAATTIEALLQTCSEIAGQDLASAAHFLVTACTTVLQAAFMEDRADRAALRVHLSRMVIGYLKEAHASR